MSTSQRIVKNTIFLYIRMGVSIFINIFTTRILLQALGISDYGLYNVVGGAIAMLGFVSASMSGTTQRFLSYSEGEGNIEKVKQVFINSIWIHRSIACITILLLSFGGIFFFNGILNIPQGRENIAIFVYICLLFSMVYSITISPYDALLNARENMFLYSLLGIADALFKLFIALIILFYDTDRLALYAGLMAFESWLLRFFTKSYCCKHYFECRKIKINKYLDKKTICEMTNFAGWNMVNISAGMLSLFGMNIVINHYFGTNLNASMGIATQLSGVLMGVSMNMIKALTPTLVKREGDRKRDQMLEVTYIGCKFSFLLFSFLCIPILIWMPFILKLWLNSVPEWTELFCRILIIATLVDQLTVFLYQTISAEGNIRTYNISRSLINIMPLIISIVIFSLGNNQPYWILINWMIFKSILGGCINIYYACKNVGMSFLIYTKRVIQPCLLVTISTVIIGLIFFSLLRGNCMLWQLSGLGALIAISIPIYWTVSINKTEKEIFKNLFFTITKRK